MEKELVQGIDHDEKLATTDSNVDTSRPFRSVKEAVAIFGERFLVGEIYSPKPFTLPGKEAPFFSPSPSWRVDKESLWKHSSKNYEGIYEKFIDSHDVTLSDTVKKLEAELEETKAELKLLKERESEKGVELAMKNAKLAPVEVAMTGKATTLFSDGEIVIMEEEKKRDGFTRMKTSDSTSLAEILSMGYLFLESKKEKKVMKKKPIIPLLGDLFSRKKSSSTSLHNSFYASPMQWN